MSQPVPVKVRRVVAWHPLTQADLDAIETARWIPPRNGQLTRFESDMLRAYGAGPDTFRQYYEGTFPIEKPQL